MRARRARQFKLALNHGPKPFFNSLLRDFFAFVRRERAQILAKFSPLAFSLAISEHSDDGFLLQQTLKLIEGLAGDNRDYAIASAYALLIGDEKRKVLSAYFTPPTLARAAMEAAHRSSTI